jgi:hypothetical protein
MKCNKGCHKFCGTAIGDEGPYQKVLCTACGGVKGATASSLAAAQRAPKASKQSKKGGH